MKQNKAIADHAQMMRERAMQLALACITIARGTRRSYEGRVFGNQLIRSSSSAAANYRAACRARTRAVFVSKLDIVVEELDETEFWLSMMVESGLRSRESLAAQLAEVDELLRVCSRGRQTADQGRK